MKWIKASERLPEDGKLVEIKTDTTRATYARWSKDNNAFVNIIDVRYPPTLYFIEWLDESATPPPVQSDSEVEFGEWQICPVCNGTGQSMNHRNMIPLTTDTCTRCNGEKIIERPSLKTKELREALEEIIEAGKDFEWGKEFWAVKIATKALNNNQ